MKMRDGVVGALGLALGVWAAMAQTTGPATGIAPATGPATATVPATAAASQAASSRDLRELAGRLVSDILTCKEVANNPTKAVIVIKSIANKTEDMAGRDMSIYGAKLASLMNVGETANRAIFVLEVANQLKQAEGAAPPASPGIKPQFALSSTIFSMNKTGKVYYLLQFRLTSLATGMQLWSGEYEVQTLN